jgi:hypothetical protein
MYGVSSIRSCQKTSEEELIKGEIVWKGRCGNEVYFWDLLLYFDHLQ